MSGDNGKPVEVEQGSPAFTFHLSITLNVVTGDWQVDYLKVPTMIALGMLKYAEILVRRRDAEMAMIAAAQNAPRIALPGDRR